MPFEVRKLRDSFAVEVTGIDLTEDHSTAEMDEIKKLWWEHQLLLFRGQSLDEADLVHFSGKLGPLEHHVRKEFLSSDNPEILLISNKKADGKPIGILADGEVGWHYDQIYLPKPAVGSLLYSVELPSSRGSTFFADMITAYERLPQAMKDKLEGKRAVQSYAAFNAKFSVPTSEEQKKKTPDLDHPLIRTHPFSGRKALYLCPGMTTQILGMDAAESEETLEYLFDWCIRDEFVYKHDWVLGDAVLWDNACSMHRREPFDASETRLMKRTTILPPPELAVPV